jgi:hypothetical protein
VAIEEEQEEEEQEEEEEAASICVKNTRINGIKPAVLEGTSNGHAFNAHNLLLKK